MPKRIDLTGRVFGELTVLEFAGKGNSGNGMYKCKCSCGAVKIIRGTSLTTNTTKTCGNTEVHFLDLTNQRFGSLFVIKYFDTHNRSRRFLCKCDCGSSKVICSKSLTTGSTKTCGDRKIHKSCGPASMPYFEEKAKEHIGEKVGKLTIIGINYQPPCRRILYVCQCECGTVRDNFLYNRIKRSKNVSCGCYAQELRSVNGAKTSQNVVYQTIKNKNYHVYNGNEKIKVRSGYEVFYAQYAKYAGINYIYEPEVFRVKSSMRYTPDFYLPDTDEYVETKGVLTPRSKEKMDLFSKDHKLTILYKKELNQLSPPTKYLKFTQMWKAYTGNTELEYIAHFKDLF